MKKIVLTMITLLLILNAGAQNTIQVKTSDGVLEGMDESGVKTFKGVPFAAPPIGNLRWKAPQAVQKWTGVRKAIEYGPNPMQENIFGDMDFGTKQMSEDCLYLNIWTPAHTMTEKLPILIYFNGGGLMAGSGSEPRYAGMSMARKGVISITANYREGIFGFFTHPDLSKETTYKGSGNYGFLDQVKAIKWVRDNIAAFGGDPERITIAGESAGSMSVSALMASPLCKGLIHQAIGSSGSVLGFKKISTLKEAEVAGSEMVQKIGGKSIKDLRDMSAEPLMKLAAVKSVPIYNVDGYFLTEQPVDVYAKGEQTKVPLLIGGNSSEMSMPFILRGKPVTFANVKEAVSLTFGDSTDQILKLYNITDDASANGDPGVELASDMFISFTTWKWGNMHKLTGGQPVYRYMYYHPRPDMLMKDKVAGLAGGVQDKKSDDSSAPKVTGAVHSADIEYAMGNLPTNRIYDWQPEDYIVSDIFINYYANFVKTGNPNGLGLPQWTPTNNQNTAPVLQIGINTYQKEDSQLEKRYDYIDKFFYQK